MGTPSGGPSTLGKDMGTEPLQGVLSPLRSMVIRETMVMQTQTNRGTSSHAVISESSHAQGGSEVRRTLR